MGIPQNYSFILVFIDAALKLTVLNYLNYSESSDRLQNFIPILSEYQDLFW